MDENNPYVPPAYTDAVVKTHSQMSLLLAAVAIGLLFYALSKWFAGLVSHEDLAEGNVQNFILAEILDGISICLFFYLITKSLGFSFGWRVVLNAFAAILAYALFVFVLFSQIPSMLLHPLSVASIVVKFIVCSTIAEFMMYELAVRWMNKSDTPEAENAEL